MKCIRYLCSALLICASSQAADSPTRPKIYNISFVRLKSTNLEASSAFYAKALGLRPGIDDCKNVSNPCFSINPYQRIELMRTGSGSPDSFLDEIGFTTNDVIKMREYLTAHSVKSTEISRGPHGLRIFEVKDPEGNQIAFVESSGKDAEVPGQDQISNRLFHAGFVVKDMAAENRFYVDVLGFRLYWQGGFKDDGLDWYELQVPDGDNWIEYMLNIPATADHKALGAQNHFSFGVKEIEAAAAQLRKNGAAKIAGPGIGRDGKRGLNVYDPDDTRVEVTEFTPAREPCCHPYTAAHPKP
jgi:catechol 2,3-dioxygenase-like lactoylglutathione lyase family enzyme